MSLTILGRHELKCSNLNLKNKPQKQPSKPNFKLLFQLQILHFEMDPKF